MVKILVFDTETSGLPPDIPGKNWEEKEEKSKKLLSFSDFKKKKSMWSSYIDQWPYIIQLSYILYDTENPTQSKIFNKYIDIPEEIEISKESMAVHHITKESIATVESVNRAKIYDALNEFMDDVEKSDVIVGHNVGFDRKMIIAELTRVSNEHKIPQIQKMMDDSNFICTMEKTQPICNLKRSISYIDKKTGETKVFQKIKPPKLLESYKHYFGYEPSGEALHDAIIDVVVCLRVYCISLDDGFDVCGTNSIITDYIMKISPPGYQCGSENEQPISNINKKHASTSKKPASTSKKPASTSKKTTYKKKTVLSTILEESRSSSNSKLSNIKSHSPKTSSSKSKLKTISTRSTKPKSISNNTKSKSTKPKSKSKKSRNEMSDFIVDDS